MIFQVDLNGIVVAPPIGDPHVVHINFSLYQEPIFLIRKLLVYHFNVTDYVGMCFRLLLEASLQCPKDCPTVMASSTTSNKPTTTLSTTTSTTTTRYGWLSKIFFLGIWSVTQDLWWWSRDIRVQRYDWMYWGLMLKKTLSSVAKTWEMNIVDDVLSLF